MSKAAALQSALSGGKARAEAQAVPELRPAEPVTIDSTPARQASRVEKVNISAWLSGDFAKGLRLIQVDHHTKNKQTLIAEALNLLFEKYNVPTVGE